MALVEEKQKIKNLGVHKANRLAFQSEVKFLLKKMAREIKTIYTVRNSLPGSSLKLILNALVLRHLHYSAVVIQSIGKHLLVSIEKQINWALKASFHRSKFESMKELRLEHNILPIKLFIATKRLLYFWKIKIGKIGPANCFLHKNGSIASYLVNSTITPNKKSFLELYVQRPKTALQNCFTRTAIKDWYGLPEKRLNSKLIAYQIEKIQIKTIPFSFINQSVLA